MNLQEINLCIKIVIMQYCKKLIAKKYFATYYLCRMEDPFIYNNIEASMCVCVCVCKKGGERPK